MKEKHLRWDSLGEFLAISVALEDISNNKPSAKILSVCLNKAIEELLKKNKSPSRKVGEIDNRGSHFYLALFWSKFLSEQNENKKIKNEFSKVYEDLLNNEVKIMKEINSNQGKSIDLKGYYKIETSIINHVMRPSVTLNNIIDNI